MYLSKRILHTAEATRGSAVFEDVSPDRLDAARGRIKFDPREELRPEAAILREEAEREGFAAGHAQGREAGHIEGLELGRREAFTQFETQLDEELKEIRHALVQAFERLTPAVELFYAEAEAQLALLAKDVVGRVLQAELKVNDEAIVAIARAAISDVAQSRSVKIRVNAVDAPVLTQHRETILRAFTGLRSIDIVEDNSIEGGCIVECDHGVVDATSTTALRLMEGDAA